MQSNREVFLRMSEEYYMSIPNEIRMVYLSSKRVDEEKSDWSENMKDPIFEKLNSQLKKSKQWISEREFQLREERLKNKNK